MQITNNQVSSYSYGANSTTQTNSSNTANSFDSYLSNTDENPLYLSINASTLNV